MKKVLIILLIFSILILLVSCKKKDDKNSIGVIDGPGSAAVDYNDLVK